MDMGAMTSASLLTHQIGAAAGPITAFDVSSNYQNVVFGDAPGCFHLYNNNSNQESGGSAATSFNPYSQETQLADAVRYFP